MSFRVVLDANVLVPARLRDVLLSLAEAGLFAPLWSTQILAEMERHLPPRMDAGARDALRVALGHAFPEAAVTWPAEVSIEGARLVNDKDRHVAMAIVAGGADALLSEDGALRGEVSDLCDTMSVAEFLAYTIDVAPEAAAAALRTMLAGWPEATTVDELGMWKRLLDWMDAQGWRAVATLLREPAPKE